MSQNRPEQVLHADLRHVIYARFPMRLTWSVSMTSRMASGSGSWRQSAPNRSAGHKPETAFLFDLGLLHDIGVSSTVTHGHLVTEFDWEAQVLKR